MRPLTLLVVAALMMGVLDAVAANAPKRSDFRPVTPEEFAIKSTPLDATAPAITLLREVTVETTDGGTSFDYYVRVKVLTAQGVEELNKTEIPYVRDTPPRKLAAQVVKPDGRAIPVAAADIFTRDVLRDRRTALVVKTFAFPGLEPGDIAEYRYSIQHEEILDGARLYFDDPFPVLQARMRIRSDIGFPGLRMQLIWSKLTGFKKLPETKRGFHVFEAENIAPIAAEPLPPPDDNIKRWFHYYFTLDHGDATTYWSYAGGDLHALAEYCFKPTKKLQEAAKKIVGTATLDRERLELLYEHCRTNIKNISYDSSGYTPDQIEKLKRNKTPTDTLTNGYGSSAQINLLFGALARAIGLQPRLAYCSDRSTVLFNEELRTRTAMPDLIVVFGENDPAYYDPGSLYLAPRQLQWKNEDTTALVESAGYWRFYPTASTKAADSAIRRTGKFELSADGTLEGDITIAYSGHNAFEAKHSYDALNEEEARKRIEQELHKRISSAEISQCKIEGAKDPHLPVTITCHVKVAGYAEVAGRRLLVQPAFFQKGTATPFPSTKRKFPVFFPFPSSEEDKVTYELPEGYELEPPRPLTTVSEGNNLHYFPRFNLGRGGRQLTYERTYLNELSEVSVPRYGWLRTMFNGIHTRDNFVLSFQAPAPAKTATTTAAAATP